MRWKALLVGWMLFGFGSFAHASDFGCKVLLCLANPKGPMAVSECVPPITELYAMLAHGAPFPACDLAGGSNDSYAKQGFSYYDPCPAGTTALNAGSYAIQGSSPNTRQGLNTSVYQGIGSGDGYDNSWSGGSTRSQKVCVGKQVGQTVMTIGSGVDDSQVVQVGIYDSVRLLDAQGSPRIIDVFINNQLFRRVRW